MIFSAIFRIFRQIREKKNITLPSVFKITFYEIRIKEAISSMLSTKKCCFNYAIVRPTNNCDAG